MTLKAIQERNELYVIGFYKNQFAWLMFILVAIR